MSTDSPGSGVPNQEGPPVDTDAKPDGSNARRASGAARRSRRKKDDDSTETPKPKKEKDSKDKEKPARAPRRPREKSTTTASSRKKPKLEQSADEATSGPAAPVAAAAPPADPSPPQPQAVPTPPQPTPTPSYSPSPYAAQNATGPGYPLSRPNPPRPQSQPPPPQPAQVPQRTSGQNFDPIRSAFDNPSPAPAYSPPARAVSPRNSYRASASPAISSIIDPPAQSSQPLYPPLPRSSSGHVSTVSSPAPPAMAPTPTHPSLAPSPMPASSPSHGAARASQPIPPSNHYAPYAASEQHPLQSQPPKLELSPPALQQQQQQPPPPPPPPQSQPHSQRQPEPAVQASTPQRPVQQPSDAMDIDSKEQPAPSAKKEKSNGTAPSSKAPSPKPARAAKEAPPLPQGSGLITNALFGGVDESKSPEARSTPNIIVHVPLQKGNQIVNFAQLAEEQYGFAALHPRLAAHKERLAHVAAAGAILERNDKGKGISAGESADEDLSLDVDRDSDMDMDGGMNGTGAGTNGAQSEAGDGKKRRRKKVEEYDRDDPFVDDSEMAWQEQAAASKDGFFVYSGPLVPEGEKVQVERADGTIKRGRGRGRGTGRGRSLASHPHVPIAAAVPISQDTGLPLRGPGSRGGTSRRARTTKKVAEGDKQTPERSGASASAPHEGRGGRGGGGSGRGGSNASTRGGKSSSGPSSMMSMMDLAPGPPSNENSSPNSSLAPASGPSPLAGPELVMK